MASKMASGSCVPVGKEECFNLRRGFCKHGFNCRYSHKLTWMEQALQNLGAGVLWIHLGSDRESSNQVVVDMEKKIGPLKREDFVEMNGKYGKFWCAVFHFESIKEDAFQILASGQCIHFEHGVRAQLFRSTPMTEEEMKAKQQADDAVKKLSPTEQDYLLKQHTNGVATISLSMHRALIRAGACSERSV